MSGNKVHYTIFQILLLKIMLCSKLHYQKSFKLKHISYEITAPVVEGRPQVTSLCRGTSRIRYSTPYCSSSRRLLLRLSRANPRLRALVNPKLRAPVSLEPFHDYAGICFRKARAYWRFVLGGHSRKLLPRSREGPRLRALSSLFALTNLLLRALFRCEVDGFVPRS